MICLVKKCRVRRELHFYLSTYTCSWNTRVERISFFSNCHLYTGENTLKLGLKKTHKKLQTYWTFLIYQRLQKILLKYKKIYLIDPWSDKGLKRILQNLRYAIRSTNREERSITSQEAEFREFESRLKFQKQLKHGWFQLKL